MELQSHKVDTTLAWADHANTAAATGAWIDCRDAEGDIAVIASVGVVTGGSVTGTIETASDDQGTGKATLTPNEGSAFTVVTGSNDPIIEKRTVNARANKGYIRYLGTIATGPATVSAIVVHRPKYTA
jgi:hypothetical protein